MWFFLLLTSGIWRKGSIFSFFFFLLVMYLNVKNSIQGQETTAGIQNGTTSNGGNNCCTKAAAELKLYQAFIFSVPIFFTFILLLLFYLFYLRRRRVDWSSLRMRTSNSLSSFQSTSEISRVSSIKILYLPESEAFLDICGGSI